MAPLTPHQSPLDMVMFAPQQVASFDRSTRRQVLNSAFEKVEELHETFDTLYHDPSTFSTIIDAYRVVLRAAARGTDPEREMCEVVMDNLQDAWEDISRMEYESIEAMFQRGKLEIKSIELEIELNNAKIELTELKIEVRESKMERSFMDMVGALSEEVKREGVETFCARVHKLYESGSEMSGKLEADGMDEKERREMVEKVCAIVRKVWEGGIERLGKLEVDDVEEKERREKERREKEKREKVEGICASLKKLWEEGRERLEKFRVGVLELRVLGEELGLVVQGLDDESVSSFLNGP